MHSLQRHFFSRIVATVLAVGALCSLPASADPLSNLPSLGDAGGAELSTQDERRLGALIMKDYRAFGAVNDDPEITSYLTRLGNRIVQAAGESPGNFEFFLVTDKSVNAFAMPGGYIGMHTGLIAQAQSESELASVLAHEVGHVTQRHIARRFGQQRQTSLVTAAAMIAAILVAGSNPDAASGLMAAGVGMSVDQQLAFSRDAEREADRVGFNMLVQAGFEPQGMVDFFGRLQQASRLYENNAPAYLRTHPLTTERIADIRNRAGLEARSRANVAPTALDFELIRVKAMVYGERTNQQLNDRLRTFEEPNPQEAIRHKASLEYGRSLVLSRMNRHEDAYKAVEKAFTEFEKSQSLVKNQAPPQLLQTQMLRSQMDINLPISERAVREQAPRSEASLTEKEKAILTQLESLRVQQGRADLGIRLFYADSLQRLGLFEKSDSYLRELATAFRSNARLFELLAQSSRALNKPAEHHLYMAQALNARGAFLPAIEQAEIAKRFAGDNYYLLAEIDAKQREYKRRADDEREFSRF